MLEAVMAMEITTMPVEAARDAEALVRDSLPALQERVFCLCLGFVGNAADARDLAQETFAKALAHAREARPQTLPAWVMRIARNTCLDLARRRTSRGPQEPVSEGCAVERRTPEDHAGRQEEIAIVRRAVVALPPQLRDVLVMREYGELPYEEIAAALGIRRGTVMSRLNRARASVLRFYREEHHEGH
ncbi:MAG TPA: RNA polymerase sigma factor [Candidatus Aminicenantes bacterium]|nr:RNA polymerase sigma factor [Candidatus Aminicenantes bacterium]